MSITRDIVIYINICNDDDERMIVVIMIVIRPDPCARTISPPPHPRPKHRYYHPRGRRYRYRRHHHRLVTVPRFPEAQFLFEFKSIMVQCLYGVIFNTFVLLIGRCPRIL